MRNQVFYKSLTQTLANWIDGWLAGWLADWWMDEWMDGLAFQISINRQRIAQRFGAASAA